MIHLFRSLVGKEELEEIRTSFEAQWLGMGPKTAAFEEAFSRRLGLRDLVLLDSCSNSLYMAVKLLNLPPASEIIVPSFAWIACGHAPVLAGCAPVFCDVDYETQNITAETAARAMTKKTRAIMVVHYAGLPVHIEEIEKLGLPIIEDAAHAVDSKRQGRYCGSLGEIGVYSFDSLKNLVMGEGGGLTTANADLLSRARQLRYCGIGKSGFEASASKDRWWEHQVADFFPKMLPSDIAASIGLAQLRKLDALQKRRREIWRRYQMELAGLDWLARPQDAPPGDQHSFFTYCIRVQNGRRDLLARFLYDNGIYTSLRYHPLHLNPIYNSSARLPTAERLNEEALCLPIHPGLSDQDLDRILEAMKAFGKKAP